MAVKTTLTAQEDFTGEFPSEWAGSGLWRFNESEPDSNDRLMDSSGNGRDFNIINWSGTTANLLEGWRGHYFRFNINNPTSEKTDCGGRLDEPHHLLGRQYLLPYF